MKEIEVGTKVLVRAEVEAFRTGLNSGTLIRVNVNGQKIWVKSEDIQLMRGFVESICKDTPKELRLPRGSAKWDCIIEAITEPDVLRTCNTKDRVSENTDGEL